MAGSLLWKGSGGMPDENTTTGTTATTTVTPGTGEDVAGLKNALAQEREARKQAEKEAKTATKTLTEVQGRLSKLESDSQSESEKAIAQARKEAAEEARTDERSKWQSRFLTEKVKATAARKLADPDDVRLLDLNEFEVNDDGSIKGDVDAAIDGLLKVKPHLAAKAGTRQSIDAGPQGGNAGESVDELFGRALTDQLK